MTYRKKNIKMRMLSLLLTLAMIFGTVATLIPTISVAATTLPNSTIDVTKGLAGNTNNVYSAPNKLTQIPLTFEATIEMTEAKLKNSGLYAGSLLASFETENEGQDTLIFDMALGGPRILIISYPTGGQKVTAGVRFDGALNKEQYYDTPVHVAIVVDVNAEETKLYINGQDSGVDPIYEHNATSNSLVFYQAYANLSLDRLPLPTAASDLRAGNGRYFQGTLYQASMFSETRTPAQIADDYVGIPEDKSNLIMWVDASKSPDNVSNVLVDISGNGYHMLNSNATTPVIDTSVGIAGSSDTIYSAKDKLSVVPKTIEATVKLSQTVIDSGSNGNNYYAGTVIGSYEVETAGNDSILMDIVNGGPRIYLNAHAVGQEGGNKYVGARFDGVLRSDAYYDKPVHIAITIDPEANKILLYLNGEKIDTSIIYEHNAATNSNVFYETYNMLSVERLPTFAVASDHRANNSRWLKGTVYQASMSSDCHSAEEIKRNYYGKMIPYDSDLLLLVDAPKSPDGASNILYDISGNGYHMINSNSESTINTTSGIRGNSDNVYSATKKLSGVPKTFEATIKASQAVINDAYMGTIVGAYGEVANGVDGIIMDLVFGGPRIYLYTQDNNGTLKQAGVRFDTALESEAYYDTPVHIAITLDPSTRTTTLYINGEASSMDPQYEYISNAEQFYTVYEMLSAERMPTPSVASDHRATNWRYFHGEVYSAAMYLECRTYGEVASDYIGVPTGDAELMIWTEASASPVADKSILTDLSGNGYTMIVTAPDVEPAAPEPFELYKQDKAMAASPNTFEAWINIPEEYATNGERAGVILGNWKSDAEAYSVDFEINTNGNPRLYVQNGAVTYNVIFSDVNVATGCPLHIALVRDGGSVLCYVDGVLKQTVTPSTAGFADVELGGNNPLYLGGDARANNTQSFKGHLYWAAMFSDARTADEIKADWLTFDENADGALAIYDIVNKKVNNHIPDVSFNDNWLYKVTFEENGAEFESDVYYISENKLTQSPNTFEAWIRLTPEDLLEDTNKGQGGVILGNYGKFPSVSFEIGANGAPRLHISTDGNENTAFSIDFDEVNVATGKYLHLAIVRDVANGRVYCYVNGLLAQSKEFAYSDDIAVGSALALGGDFRTSLTDSTTKMKNEQYFKGFIYSTSVYSDVRTADEIKSDYLGEKEDTDQISKYTIKSNSVNLVEDESGNLCAMLRSVPSGDGLKFAPEFLYSADKQVTAVPKTFEATIKMSKEDLNGRADYLYAGVITGFSDEVGAGIFMDVARNGPRIYIREYKESASAYKAAGVRFDDTLIPYIDKKVHVAITINPDTDTVTLYLDGQFVREARVTYQDNGTIADGFDYEYTANGGKEWFFTAYDQLVASELNYQTIGGDHRSGNGRAFTGTVYNAAVFADVRSASEVAADKVGMPASDANLIAWHNLTSLRSLDGFKDLSGNEYYMKKLSSWAEEAVGGDKILGTDYSYSFAVVGDTQVIAKNYPDDFHKIYDYIINNKAAKNIQFVFGLGDITETIGVDSQSSDEWLLAIEQIQRLDAVVPHSFVRGNHDDVTEFNQYLSYTRYKRMIDGSFEENMLNTYRFFTVGEIDYLMMSLDYGASDDVLNWASGIIGAYPNHNVIITTHAYLYRDGTTLDAGDVCPPATSGGYNNGDDIWEKLVKKHSNIVLVMSGHDPSDSIVCTKATGVGGNEVAQILIDPQGIDAEVAPSGMVAMLYFSEDGRNMSVEWYSTIQETYYKESNQFATTLNVIERAADTDETVDEDAPVVSVPEEPSTGNVTVTYGVSDNYVVVVPSEVAFGNDRKSTTGEVIASEVLIRGGQTLVVKVRSSNGWKLTTKNSDGNAPVDYTANLVKNNPDESVPKLENDSIILSVPCAADGLGGSAMMYFDNEGTTQAGDYGDVLTFSVEIN